MNHLGSMIGCFTTCWNRALSAPQTPAEGQGMQSHRRGQDL